MRKCILVILVTAACLLSCAAAERIQVDEAPLPYDLLFAAIEEELGLQFAVYARSSSPAPNPQALFDQLDLGENGLLVYLDQSSGRSEILYGDAALRFLSPKSISIAQGHLSSSRLSLGRFYWPADVVCVASLVNSLDVERPFFSVFDVRDWMAQFRYPVIAISSRVLFVLLFFGVPLIIAISRQIAVRRRFQQLAQTDFLSDQHKDSPLK